MNKERPWYQWQNAQIAFRDKGIPIPEYLKPSKVSTGPNDYKVSNLPPEFHRGDYARAYGKKVNLPWLFRYPERRLDFEVAQRTIVSGKVLSVTEYGVTIAAPRKKPAYYWFHERLFNKTVQEKAMPAFSYLKTDIKVGDIVDLGMVEVDYTVAIADIRIVERPGGLVPPPQIVDKLRPYHERRNAEIAFRDKGTPIPNHLRPILPACAAGSAVIGAQILLAQWKLNLDPKLDFDESELSKSAGIVLALTDTEITVQDKLKKVVAYPFHDRLADGGIHKKATEANSYRRYDVRVGDLLTLGLASENSKIYCVELCITERPAGRVPAGVIVDQTRPWYQLRNAEIAFRDKGTPIPEHLKPKLPTVPKETNDPPKK